jgi:predicted cupin superfamily sugar epimerase
MTADDIIRALDLKPHPEGGHFRETFRDEDNTRGASTAIYYLLRRGERSHWHRVDAAEVWHFYAGDPLELALSADGRTTQTHVLGANLAKGERPQIIVPKNVWQSARPLGVYTLVGCTVAPAFTFEGFEMAAPDWRPNEKSG